MYFEIKEFIRIEGEASDDGGQDIIVDMDGYRFMVQCKAWYYKCIVVRRGNFDFGILVGVLEQKIAKGAYDAADESGGDIIVTLYTRMCQDIKRLITGRLTEQIRILENRNRLLYHKLCTLIFVLTMNQTGSELCYKGWQYQYGIDIEKDKRKAFRCYYKATLIGSNPNGIFKTAIFYRYETGIEENHTKFVNGEKITDLLKERTSLYRKCAYCNKFNTNKSWCQTCDPDMTIRGWTSRDKKIDDYIKSFQLRTVAYEDD
ncbi:hypothetical protein C2G38_2170629 [Gigaspora rosea]|uniref:Restriction endonuclease type IV Mrr domain-containing protein n=1 Tax=Gigaspora rosea TaxID=44941 RepID=A0A397VQT4_9GLOM|nr:hypothetical protein C2G38_2170629 [Gigaspora rosea]